MQEIVTWYNSHYEDNPITCWVSNDMTAGYYLQVDGQEIFIDQSDLQEYFCDDGDDDYSKYGALAQDAIHGDTRALDYIACVISELANSAVAA